MQDIKNKEQKTDTEELFFRFLNVIKDTLKMLPKNKQKILLTDILAIKDDTKKIKPLQIYVYTIKQWLKEKNKIEYSKLDSIYDIYKKQ